MRYVHVEELRRMGCVEEPRMGCRHVTMEDSISKVALGWLENVSAGIRIVERYLVRVLRKCGCNI